MDSRLIRRRGKKFVVSSSSSSSSSSEDHIPLQSHRRASGAVARKPSVASAPSLAAIPSSAGPESVPSTMILPKVKNLRVRYGIPEGIRLSASSFGDRVTAGLAGEVTMYEEFFEAGLRLLLHPFVASLLKRYDLLPAQLSPISIRTISAFIVLCHYHSLVARVSLFWAMYSLAAIPVK